MHGSHCLPRLIWDEGASPRAATGTAGGTALLIGHGDLSPDLFLGILERIE